MCDKKPYCNRQIDECIRLEVKILPIQHHEIRKTVASCCGHGRYPKSIIVELMNGRVIEWFTKIKLSDKHKKGAKYYTKDLKGYYFIQGGVIIDRNNL